MLKFSFYPTEPSEVDDLHITFKDKTTVNVAWAPPNPPNGPLEHMWYRIEGQLGDKPFSNESRSTLVDLSFNKDCGTDSEEVMVRVTALMKEDPQNVLKGQPSNTVKETICGLTSIPVFYFNVNKYTVESKISLNMSVQDNPVVDNVSIGIHGNRAAVSSQGEVSGSVLVDQSVGVEVDTEAGQFEPASESPIKEGGIGNDRPSDSKRFRHKAARNRIRRHLRRKFTWMVKMTHVCRWRENYRFYKELIQK